MDSNNFKTYSFEDFIKNLRDAFDNKGDFKGADRKILESMMANIVSGENSVMNKGVSITPINLKRSELFSIRNQAERENQIKLGQDMFSLESMLGKVNYELNRRYGMSSNYSFNPKNGNIIMQLDLLNSNTNQTARKQWDTLRESGKLPKIELQIANSQGIIAHNNQLAIDPFIKRVVDENTAVIINSSQSFMKDFFEQITNERSYIGSSLKSYDGEKIQRVMKNFKKDEYSTTPTIGLNRNVMHDAIEEIWKETPRLKVGVDNKKSITSQQLRYINDQSSKVFFSRALEDIFSMIPNSVPKYMSQNHLSYDRASSEIMEQIKNLYLLAATGAYGEPGNENTANAIKRILETSDDFKFLTSSERLKLQNSLINLSKSGEGLGGGSESNAARGIGFINRARDSKPFGIFNSRESRTFNQVNAIGTPRQGKPRINTSYNATAHGAPLIRTKREIREQEEFLQEHPDYSLNYDTDSLFHVLSVSSDSWNKALDKAQVKLDSLSDGKHKKKLITALNQLKTLGFNETGMIMKGDMRENLNYDREISRNLFEGIDLQKEIDELNEQETVKATKDPKYKKKTLEQLEKIAVKSLIGKELNDPNSDFSVDDYFTDEETGAQKVRITQHLKGENAHRLHLGDGTRIVPSWAPRELTKSITTGGQSLWDFILNEIGVSSEEIPLIQGVREINAQYSERKFGEYIHGDFYKTLEDLEKKGTAQKFVQEFNKKYQDFFGFDEKTKSFQYNEDKINAKFDSFPNSQKGKLSNEFIRDFFTIAQDVGGVESPYVWNKNNEAFLKKNFLVQATSINPADIATYGSPYSKRGEWMPVDRKVSASISRTLKNSPLTKELIDLIQGTYKIKEDDYNNVIKSYGNSFKTAISQDTDESKTLILSLDELQQTYENYRNLEKKYSSAGGFLKKEANDLSPYGYIEKKIRERANKLGINENEFQDWLNNLDVLLDIGQEYSINNEYDPTSKTYRSNLLALNMHKGRPLSTAYGDDSLYKGYMMNPNSTGITLLNSLIAASTGSDKTFQNAIKEYTAREFEHFLSPTGEYFQSATKGYLPHSAMLSAISSNSLGENVSQGNAQKFLKDGGVILNPNTLAGLLKSQKNDGVSDNVDRLKSIYQEMNPTTKLDFLPNKLENATDDEDLNKRLLLYKQQTELINKIVDSVNFDLNPETAAKNAEMLTSIVGRSPYIYGQDLGFTALATMNKGVEANQILMGMGRYRSMNADFDADKIQISSLSSQIDPIKFKEEFARARKESRELSQLTDYFITPEYSKNQNTDSYEELADQTKVNKSNYKDYFIKNKDTQKYETPTEYDENLLTQYFRKKPVFDDDTLNNLNNATMDSVTEVASRTNRRFIGTFSMINQSIRDGLTLAGLDETLEGNGVNSARTAVVRELFSSLEQDAISAKKIKNRMGLRPEETIKAEDYVNELNKLKEEAFGRDADIFQDKDKVLSWLKNFADVDNGLGILGSSDNAFKSGKAKGRLANLFKNISAEDLAEAFGIGIDQAEQLRPYNADGTIKNGYDINIALEQIADALVATDKKLRGNQDNYLFNKGIKGLYDNRGAIEQRKFASEYQQYKFISKNMAGGLEELNALIDSRNELYDSANNNNNNTNPYFTDDFKKEDMASYIEQYKEQKKLDLKALYKKNFGTFHGKGVTKLIHNSLFPWSSSNTDYDLSNEISGIQSSDELNEWVNSKDSQETAMNLLKSGWLHTGSGKARHAIAEVLLKAQKEFGLTDFTKFTDESLEKALSENENFKNWYERPGESGGFTATQKQMIDNYKIIADYFYGENKNKKFSSWDLIKEAGENYAKIMGGAGDYVGTELKINSILNGSEYQGIIDYMSIGKETKKDEEGKETVKKYLDIYDMKPGKPNNLPYGTQVLLYKNMMEPYELLAKKEGQTYQDFLQNPLIAQWGEDNGAPFREDIFDLMRSDEYGGVRANIVYDDSTGTRLYKGINDRVKNDRLMGSIYKSLRSETPMSELINEEYLGNIINGAYVETGSQIAKVNPEDVQKYIQSYMSLADIMSKIHVIQAKIVNASGVEEISLQNKLDILRETKAEEQKKFDEHAERLESTEQGKRVLDRLWNDTEGEKGILSQYQEGAEDNSNRQIKEIDAKKYESLLKQQRQLSGQLKDEKLALSLSMSSMDEVQIEQLKLDIELREKDLALIKTQLALIRLSNQTSNHGKPGSGITDSQFAQMEEKEKDLERKADNIRNLKAAKTLSSSQPSSNIFSTFGQNFKASFKAYLGYQTSAYMLLGKLKQGIQTVVKQIQTLNKTMVDLQIVTGGTVEETQALISEYSKLGKSLGASTTEVANAANNWLRQGYKAQEVTDLITSSLYLSKLGMISSEEATKNLTSALKGFKLEASEALSIVDKLTAVDMSAAISAGDIATGLSEFATTAQLSGLDMDQAIALVSTITDVTQSSSSSVGAALKTILTRFGNVKPGAYQSLQEGEEDDTSINDVEKVITKIGISLRSSTNEMRDFDDVLEDVADKWNTLDQVSKNALATAFAGVRQREAFLVLMENMDKYHELIEVSQSSEGLATEKYLSYSEQLEASQKRLIAAWEDIGNNANIQSLIINIQNIGTWLTEKLPTVFKWLARISTTLIAGRLPSILGKLAGLTGISSVFNNQNGFKYNVSGLYGKISGINANTKLFSGDINVTVNTLGTKIVNLTNSIERAIRTIDGRQGKKGVGGNNSSIAISDLPQQNFDTIKKQDFKLDGLNNTSLAMANGVMTYTDTKGATRNVTYDETTGNFYRLNQQGNRTSKIERGAGRVVLNNPNSPYANYYLNSQLALGRPLTAEQMSPFTSVLTENMPENMKPIAVGGGQYLSPEQINAVNNGGIKRVEDRHGNIRYYNKDQIKNLNQVEGAISEEVPNPAADGLVKIGKNYYSPDDVVTKKVGGKGHKRERQVPKKGATPVPVERLTTPVSTSNRYTPMEGAEQITDTAAIAAGVKDGSIQGIRGEGNTTQYYKKDQLVDHAPRRYRLKRRQRNKSINTSGDQYDQFVLQGETYFTKSELAQIENGELTKMEVNGQEGYYNKADIETTTTYTPKDGAAPITSQEDIDQGMADGTVTNIGSETEPSYYRTTDLNSQNISKVRSGATPVGVGTSVGSEKGKKITQAKQAQKMNGANAKQAKARGTAIAVTSFLQAGAGAVMGAITAPKSGTATIGSGRNQQQINVAFNAEEQKQAQTLGTVTGGLSAIPVLGQLFQVLGDTAIQKGWFGIGEKSRYLAQVEAKADSRSKALSDVSSNINTLGDLSEKSIWSSDDQDSWDKNQSAIIANLSKGENREASKQFSGYLVDILQNQGKSIENGSSLLDITQKMNSSIEDQKILAQAMLVAEKKAAKENLRDQLVTEYAEAGERGKDAYWKGIKNTNYRPGERADEAKQVGLGATGAAAGAAGAMAAGAAATAMFTGAAFASVVPVWGWIAAGALAVAGAATAGVSAIISADAKRQAENEANSKSYDDMISDLEDQKDLLGESNSSQKDLLEAQIAELKAIKQEVYQLNKQIDEATISEALAGATIPGDAEGAEKFLSLLSTSQLKSLGPDEIERAVADYIINNGGLMNGQVYLNKDTKELTTYAKTEIRSQMKNDEKYADIYSGKAYSLAEALKLPSQKKDKDKVYENEIYKGIKENFANVLGLGTEDLDKLFNSTERNVEVEQKFANSLGITGGQVSNLKDAFNRLTLKDFLLTTQEAIEKIKTLNSTIGDLAGNSVTEFEKSLNIISQYPQYIEKIGDTGALLKIFWEDTNALILSQNKNVVQEILQNTEYYSQSILPLLENKKLDTEGVKKETTLQGLINYALKTKTDENSKDYAIADDLLAVVNEASQSWSINNDLKRELLSPIIEYQTHLLDKQLESINAQKEALKEINSQREYENQLVDARIKLENAQKNKKRVWREGVGWTYEADQEGIKEAQKNIDDLEREKDVANLELQAEEIEVTKNILNEIGDQLKWENMKLDFEAWLDPNKAGSSINAIIEAIKSDYAGTAVNGSDIVQGEINTTKKEMDTAKNTYQTAWDEYMQLFDKNNGSLKQFLKSDGSVDTDSLKQSGAGNVEKFNSAVQNLQTKYSEAANSGAIGNSDFNSLDNTNAFSKNAQNISTDSSLSNLQAPKKLLFGGDTEETATYVLSIGDGDPKTAAMWGSMADYDNGNKIWLPGQEMQSWKSWNENYGYNRDWYKNHTYSDFAKEHPSFLYYDDDGENLYYSENGRLHPVYVEKDKAAGLFEADHTIYDREIKEMEGLETYFAGSANVLNWGEAKSNTASNYDGNLSFKGGPSFINELGTEAIITPAGTLTALPSATGIVPADITKNLWQLGELAPNILNGLLEPSFGFNQMFNKNGSSTEESFNVNTINMTVNADGSFNPEAWVAAIKTKAALSKNNR